MSGESWWGVVIPDIVRVLLIGLRGATKAGGFYLVVETWIQMRDENHPGKYLFPPPSDLWYRLSFRLFLLIENRLAP